MIEIPENDETYLAWLDANPAGFVVNTRAARWDSTYMVLHRATCPAIGGPGARRAPGAFTERGYIKICSMLRKELADWVASHGRPDGTFSSEKCHCKP